MLKNCRAACNYAHRKFNRPKGVVHHTEIRKQHKLCKQNSLPFMVSSIASRIFVFMLLQSLLSISKVDPPQYTWHSLTLARPLTKLVTGHFKKNDWQRCANMFSQDIMLLVSTSRNDCTVGFMSN